METPPDSGNYVLIDVHGAGAQRSDPKIGAPDDYPNGHGSQGDVIRIYNYVRMVRAVATTAIGENEIDKNNLNIYPNPVNDLLTLLFENPYSTDNTVKIMVLLPFWRVIILLISGISFVLMLKRDNA